MKAIIANSKYLIAGACFLVAAVVAILGAREDAKPAKYYMVERETKVRPARFEDLKYHLEPAGVEMRAPASADH